MSFGTCPVVRIVSEAAEGFSLINASDFNKDIHTLFEDVVKIAEGVVEHVVEKEAGFKADAPEKDAGEAKTDGQAAGAGEPGKPPEGAGAGWGSQVASGAASEAGKPPEPPPAEAAAKATKAK